VNKILGLLVLGLAFSLTIGTVGCNTKDKDKDKDKTKADKAADKADKAADKADKAADKADKAADKADKAADKADKAADKAADKTADKAADKKKEDATSTIEIKEIKQQETKKAGDQTVKVELTKAAPADLTIKGHVNKVDEKIVHATGSIKKGESAGDLVITTKDAPAGVHTLDLVISGDKASGKGSFKIEVK
jgi:hypothetical protein